MTKGQKVLCESEEMDSMKATLSLEMPHQQICMPIWHPKYGTQSINESHNQDVVFWSALVARSSE